MSMHKLRRQNVQAEGDHSRKNWGGEEFGKSQRPSDWSTVGDKVAEPEGLGTGLGLGYK